ncbi:hypothetical protein LIA77_00242 [Sarocladium implicatum]|nr:hypothetical protein LIA77_00242 [Sarocladium implicatum]
MLVEASHHLSHVVFCPTEPPFLFFPCFLDSLFHRCKSTAACPLGRLWVADWMASQTKSSSPKARHPHAAIANILTLVLELRALVHVISYIDGIVGCSAERWTSSKSHHKPAQYQASAAAGVRQPALADRARRCNASNCFTYYTLLLLLSGSPIHLPS